MKKNIEYAIIIIICIVLGISLGYMLNKGSNNNLPEKELSEGLRGTYGIDKNINEKTIDEYLNRGDTVYRDVRMLVDSATWENKGGDRYLSGYIKGFEVVPAPYLVNYTDEYIAQKEKENVSGLYTGNTLFHVDEDGNYTANYKESMSILESIFPKDKNIFIMCGAGGYAGEITKMLIALGWDESKVRNIGGYWYYEGVNSISTKTDTGYNFSMVPYYDIDFDTLEEIQ